MSKFQERLDKIAKPHLDKIAAKRFKKQRAYNFGFKLGATLFMLAWMSFVSLAAAALIKYVFNL